MKQEIKHPIFFNYVKTMNYQLVRTENQNTIYGLKYFLPVRMYKPIVKI